MRENHHVACEHTRVESRERDVLADRIDIMATYRTLGENVFTTALAASATDFRAGIEIESCDVLRVHKTNDTARS